MRLYKGGRVKVNLRREKYKKMEMMRLAKNSPKYNHKPIAVSLHPDRNRYINHRVQEILLLLSSGGTPLPR